MTAPSPAGLSPLLDQLDEALRNRGTSLYADEVYAATVPAALPQLTAVIRAVAELTDSYPLGTDVPVYRLHRILTALTPGADTAGATA